MGAAPGNSRVAIIVAFACSQHKKQFVGEVFKCLSLTLQIGIEPDQLDHDAILFASAKKT
jgi:hypothetical protein